MTQQLSKIPDASNMPIAAQPQTDALVAAVSQREIAEVQAMMLVAQRFPRDEMDARERILIACQRPGLAEGAMYTYARGGTPITGPSIRLAEAIAQNWGNLDFGIRELDQRPGESTMQAYAWDTERNVRQVRAFKVKHTRHTKRGSYALEDPRDIYEMTANQGARRVRACILGLIPGDVVEDAVTQCEETLKAKADTSPEGVKKMLDAFAKYGVTKGQIKKRLQREIEAMSAAQMVGLLKIYTSLKDGMSEPAEWFEPAKEGDEEAEAQGGNAKAKDALKRQRGAKQESPVDEAPADPKPAEPAPVEAPDEPADEPAGEPAAETSSEPNKAAVTVLEILEGQGHDNKGKQMATLGRTCKDLEMAMPRGSDPLTWLSSLSDEDLGRLTTALTAKPAEVVR